MKELPHKNDINNFEHIPRSLKIDNPFTVCNITRKVLPDSNHRNESLIVAKCYYSRLSSQQETIIAMQRGGACKGPLYQKGANL